MIQDELRRIGKNVPEGDGWGWDFETDPRCARAIALIDQYEELLFGRICHACGGTQVLPISEAECEQCYWCQALGREPGLAAYLNTHLYDLLNLKPGCEAFKDALRDFTSILDRLYDAQRLNQ